MVRKVLYSLSIIIGVYVMIGPLFELFDVVAIMISSDRAYMPLGIFIYLFFWIAIGFALVLFGYRRLKLDIQRKKEDLNDLGQE